MQLIKGPFNFKLGDDEIQNIQNFEFNYEDRTENYTSLKGNVFELDRSKKISMVITLLSTDIDALAIVLPQLIVDGNLDLSNADCEEDYNFRDLVISPCGVNPQINTFANVRTKFDGLEIDSKIQKVRIKLLVEPITGRPQMRINRDTLLAMEDGSYFITEGGQNIII